MADSEQETEIKYEATAGTTLPSFDELPQVARTREAGDEQLDAEYFDTPDLRLIRAGITLRRREGGHDAGWHLKLPAGMHTRLEIRLPPGAAGQEVPDELARLVRVHTRGGHLEPVARISTLRRRLLLLDDAGSSLAEVASDQVTAQATGDSARVSSWHEVEVELTGGDTDVLAAADRLLRQEGLDRAGQSAKLARALGLPPPERPRPLSPSPSAGEVILGYVEAQLAALRSLDPMVRGSEPDAVHQMRTTVRRLRSTLQSFERLFAAASVTRRVAAELRWLGGVLGEARDAEVLAAHLTEQVSQMSADLVAGPVLARIRGHFASSGADAQARVLKALDSPRYFALLDQLDLLISEPPLTSLAGRPAGEVLPAAVRRAYARTRRRMTRALRAPAGARSDLALHRARRAAKRGRYAAEAVTMSVGRDARRFARQMQRLQSVLGEHQDAVIARQADRELGISAHLAGENAFSYGVLFERDGHEADRQRELAVKVWRKASRARYRRWLR
jgi:CHAD domain-containing protein